MLHLLPQLARTLPNVWLHDDGCCCRSTPPSRPRTPRCFPAIQPCMPCSPVLAALLKRNKKRRQMSPRMEDIGILSWPMCAGGKQITFSAAGCGAGGGVHQCRIQPAGVVPRRDAHGVGSSGLHSWPDCERSYPRGCSTMRPSCHVCMYAAKGQQFAGLPPPRGGLVARACSGLTP